LALSKAKKDSIKRALSKQKTKQNKGTGVDVPVALELYYFRELNRLVRTMTNAVNSHITPLLNPAVLQDAKDPFIDAVDKLQRRMQFLRLAEEVATDVVNKGDKFNRTVFIRNIKKDMGVDVSNILTDKGLKKLLDKRIKENVDLIKTIPKEYFARVRVAIKQGRKADDTAFSIRKDLKQIGKITQNRAKLIARDQVSKTNAALNEFRQQDIGVTEYTWRTSGDERVREDHRANNGRKFRWDKPPSKTGHPGHDVQCRCTADPDFSYLKRL